MFHEGALQMEKCERTTAEIASLAGKQMRSGKRNQRRVAASALRARKRSGKRSYKR